MSHMEKIKYRAYLFCVENEINGCISLFNDLGSNGHKKAWIIVINKLFGRIDVQVYHSSGNSKSKFVMVSDFIFLAWGTFGDKDQFYSTNNIFHLYMMEKF